MFFISKNKEFLKGLIAGMFFIGLIYLGSVLVGSVEAGNKLEELGFWSPILFVLLKASTVIITPLGGSPVYLIAEPLFGFYKGISLTLIGDIIGYSFNFWIGRVFGLYIINKVLNQDQLIWVRRLTDRVSNWRNLVVLLIATAPFADAMAYGIGMSKVRYPTYITGVAICSALYSLLMISFGATIVKDTQTYLIAIFLVFILSAIMFKVTQGLRNDIVSK